MAVFQIIGSKFAKNPSFWICVLLVLGIAGIYWPVIGFSFIDYDDNQYVWNNPHVLSGLSWSGIAWAFSHFHASNWHPLTWLSHMLDVQIYSLKAGGHHLTNVLFHAANSILLFLWLKQATRALWRSALVAALFALYPLHVESVAWVAERKDVLSAFFFWLTLMAYTRYANFSKKDLPSTFPDASAKRKSKTVYYCLSLMCFVLGLMSKPMLVTLPFILLLLDFWPLNRIGKTNAGRSDFAFLLLEKIPFFVLSAISCVVTYFAQQSTKAVMSFTVLPIDIRIENTIASYAGYLEKMIWPSGLAPFYPLYYPIDAEKLILPFLGLLLISIVVFIFRKQRPYLAVGWLWYLGTLVPVIGLIQVGAQSMADRYTYLPLTGIFIALVWLLADLKVKWPHWRAVLIISYIVILGVCWKLSAEQVLYWQNSETLARHSLAVTEYNAPMEILLGNALSEQKKIEEAGQHYAEAVRIWPDNVTAQCDLALSLAGQGKVDEAIDICKAALEIKPHELMIHNLLANLYLRRGNYAEAITEYQSALQINPKQTFVLNNLAWLLATAPDSKFRNGSEAVEFAEKACQLSDYQVTVYVGTLGAAYAEAGRFDEAVKTAQKAIALATAEKNNVLTVADDMGQVQMHAAPAATAEDSPLVRKNRELLELYLHKKAYREIDGR